MRTLWCQDHLSPLGRVVKLRKMSVELRGVELKGVELELRGVQLKGV
jgi:hypothetical protein